LRRFLRADLAGYRNDRNQPQLPRVSHLSMYLHFGQISPLEIALEVDGMRDRPAEDRQSFLEELIVRRELAQNFVEYTEHYDTYECLPQWARATLKKHAADERPQIYTIAQLENAETHDSYWNAAMLEMKHTGYMHNLLRMYWGKKILEWSASPEEAYRTTLTLNNRYFLDGRDANSFTNVGWLFGLHDRPWPERPIYGTVRTMTASGLERKCDIEAYVRRVNRLARRRELRQIAHAH
jgi:deoxyribodipyrimidine photo-lyase